MENTIFIALISTSAALIGALIPTLFTYFNNKNQNKFELNKNLLEKQKDTYVEIMFALQEIINHQGNIEFYALQKAAIKLSIYGDNSSSKTINLYYNQIVKAAQKERAELTREEHQLFHKSIINGMRQNLGLEKLEFFELVGFHPI